MTMSIPHIDELDPSEPLILKPGEKIHLTNGRADGQTITIQAQEPGSLVGRIIGGGIVAIACVFALLGSTAGVIMLINFITSQAAR
jgi:hypothetical protein